MKTSPLKGKYKTFFHIALPVFLSLIFTLITFNYVKDNEIKHRQIIFERQANNIAQSLMLEIKTYESIIYSLNAFFNTREDINRQEFNEFTKLFLKRNQGIQALEWIPRVKKNNLSKLEKRALDDGFSKFEVKELGTNKKMIPVLTREEYFPVYYLEPFKNNETALGFDLGSNPKRLRALEKARDTGNAVATSRISLVQDKIKQNGILIFLPVYKKNAPKNTVETREKNLEGFTLGVFKISKIMEAVLEELMTKGIDITLIDDSAEGENRFLYSNNKDKINFKVLKGSNNVNFNQDFDISDRIWSLNFIANSSYLEDHRIWKANTILALGIMFACFLIIFLTFLFKRTTRSEELIVERTADLLEANNELKREVIERKRVEEELKKNETKTKAIFENIIDGIVTISDTGIIDSFNLGAEKIFGYKSDEVKGKNVKILMPEPYHNHHDTYINNYKSTGIKKIIGTGREVLGKRKDGTIFPLELSISEVNLGEKRLFAGILRNISERKQHEETISKQTNELKIKIKELNCLYDIYNLYDKKDLSITEAYQGTIDLIPSSWQYPNITSARANLTFEGKIFKTKSFKETKWKMSSNIFVFGEHTGKLDVFYIKEMKDEFEGPFLKEERDLIDAITDQLGHVTERIYSKEKLKDAKDMAESANKAKSEFLANMSHEIRTPMNAIIGFSDLLSEIVTDEKQKSYVNAILVSGKNLLTLINDILDLSKIEAGKMEINYEPTNISDIFLEIKQIFSEKTDKKGLTLNIVIDEKIPKTILLDETRLRQIILNLVGNAVKFTDKGSIIINAKLLNKNDILNNVDIDILIIDTGIGFPKNQTNIIFESFKQQYGQKNRTYGGTGLGLAITKRLTLAMNGKVSAESEINKGSTFKVSFKEVSVPTLKESDDIQSKTSNFNNIKFEPSIILVVDDIASNRFLMNELLTRLGFSVIEAEDGKKAISVTNEKTPNLIFMDIRLPLIDGFEACNILKKNINTKGIPIIALTASLETKDNLKLKGKKFDGYLFKPVKMSDIIFELSKHLKHTIIDHEGAKTIDTNNNDSSFENINDLSELLISLEKIKPTLTTLEGAFEIDDIFEFSNKLLKLGQEHNAKILTEFSNKLYVEAQSFNVSEIEKLLSGFTKIVESLKKQ